MDSTLDIINKYPELQKGFSWIIKNSNSNHLPYHNLNHLLTVVRYSHGATQFYQLDVKSELEILMAALFHDVNHSGGKETHDVNVEVAIKSFQHFISLIETNINVDEVSRIIKSTQYPYVIEVEHLDLKQQIIRDADLMQVFEYNWIQQNMMGLSTEMGIPLSKMILGQKDFLMSVKFNTTWGQFWGEQRWDDVEHKLEQLIQLYNIEI